MSLCEYRLDIKEFFSSTEPDGGNVFIITAIDILGFSNYVMNNYRVKSKRETLQFIMRYLNVLADDACKIALFSDCFFLFLRVRFDKNIYSDFRIMLQNIEKVISAGMADGFLLRGAMCVGECIIEDNVFFGPGIIKAHFLEEKMAKSARIIMDSFDYKQLKTLFCYASELEQIDMGFIKDDEYYAFDYIEAMYSFTNWSIDMLECLRRYKRQILRCRNQIVESCDDENIEKYLSKLNYHIKSYYRIVNEYSPDFIPIDLKNLD